MHSNRTIAFIPARGGSKRLPGKNTKLFNGNPLLYYTINYAKKQNYSIAFLSQLTIKKLPNWLLNMGPKW